MPNNSITYKFSEKFQSFIDDTHPGMNNLEIKETFYKYFKYSAFISSMPKDNESTMSVYRITRAFPNMKVDSHKSYSYAPICKSPNGRANIKYNPIFYGALDPLTAISEMKGSLGLNTSFYISEWKLKPGKTIIYNMLGN